MNKIVILCLLISISYAETLRYASLGFGSYQNSFNRNGFELKSDIGLKDEFSKIYITMDYIFFSDKYKDIDLLMYSINYDKLFKKRYKNIPYIGGGLNYINIKETLLSNDNKSSVHRLGFNIKSGLIYEISNNFSLNYGFQYVYVDYKNVHNTYGGFINIEFNR